MRDLLFISFIGLFLLFSCKKKGCTDPLSFNYDENAKVDDGSCEYGKPYELEIPPLFSQYILPPVIPNDNPLTVEGIQLGRKLFYEPMLSADNSQSCSDCHSLSNAFTDVNQFSTGIDNISGDRNSMPLFNLAWNWNNNFFWDGRASSLENQAFEPVVNPIEMHETWPDAVAKLQNDNAYPNLFKSAFGTCIIDSVFVSKALSQFERTLISGNSKFDRHQLHLENLTIFELEGYDIYRDETKGDCIHCHGDVSNPLWTDNEFHNNGLDATFTDLGLGAITGDPADIGLFKTPSLRNLAFTAPYMHDGRFEELSDVILHYSIGLVNSPTIDALMKKVNQGGVGLTPGEMMKLELFLLTLSDSSFITNSNFSKP